MSVDQIGAVVPFAHTFAAQTDTDGVQRTVQCGIEPDGLALGGRQRRWRSGHGDLPPELLQRQLLIKAARASDTLEQAGGLGRRRVQRHHGPRLPVDPGWITPRLVAHRIDAAMHLLPAGLGIDAAGFAQVGAHFPGQHLVAQVGVAGHLIVTGQGVGQQPPCGLPPQRAPHPVALFAAELGRPFLEAGLGRVNVVGRHLDQGQYHQFLAYFAVRAAAGEKLGRVGEQVRQLWCDIGGDDLDGAARGARAVGLDRQPRLAPGMSCAQLSGVDQPLCSQRATLVGFFLPMPVPAHFVGEGSRVHRRIALKVNKQRVAAHLAVVPHAVKRVFDGKLGPLTPLAQQQQPVIAQAVFLVASLKARQETLHLCGAGVIQPGSQLPVGSPGLKQMAARAR